MSIQLLGSANSAVADVDASWRALRVTQRPSSVYGAYSTRMMGSTVTAVAAAANLVSLRWASQNALALIHRISMGIQVSIASTSVLPEFVMYRARGFTTSDSAGTAVTTDLQSSMCQLRQRHAYSTSFFARGGGDMRFRTGASLTAGTRTLDTIPTLRVGAALALASRDQVVWSAGNGQLPIVLEVNEGLVWQNLSTLTTAGAYQFIVQIDWLEVARY